MKIVGTMVEWLFGEEDVEVTNKERFVSSVIRTRAFSNLSLEDRISSLCRLIAVFRADCGFNPKTLERTLILLNEELKRKSNKGFRTLIESLGKIESTPGSVKALPLSRAIK